MMEEKEKALISQGFWTISQDIGLCVGAEILFE
jgi:hypothetical protein